MIAAAFLAMASATFAHEALCTVENNCASKLYLLGTQT